MDARKPAIRFPSLPYMHRRMGLTHVTTNTTKIPQENINRAHEAAKMRSFHHEPRMKSFVSPQPFSLLELPSKSSAKFVKCRVEPQNRPSRSCKQESSHVQRFCLVSKNPRHTSCMSVLVSDASMHISTFPPIFWLPSTNVTSTIRETTSLVSEALITSESGLPTRMPAPEGALVGTKILETPSQEISLGSKAEPGRQRVFLADALGGGVVSAVICRCLSGIFKGEVKISGRIVGRGASNKRIVGELVGVEDKSRDAVGVSEGEFEAVTEEVWDEVPVGVPVGVPVEVFDGVFDGVPECVGVGVKDGEFDGVTEAVPEFEGVAEGVPDEVPVGVPVGVPVDVIDGVSDGVREGVCVGVNEGEFDGVTEGVPEFVGVAVGVPDEVPVGVAVGVPVDVFEGVCDGAGEGVCVGVNDGEFDGVVVGVSVLEGVPVAVPELD